MDPITVTNNVVCFCCSKTFHALQMTQTVIMKYKEIKQISNYTWIQSSLVLEIGGREADGRRRGSPNRSTNRREAALFLCQGYSVAKFTKPGTQHPAASIQLIFAISRVWCNSFGPQA